MTDSADVVRDARGWRAHADALAHAILDRLPNRVDVWGSYIRPDRRQPDRPHTWTAPAKERRGVESLSVARVARHFAARDGGDVIGLHTTAPDGTSRFFGLDFDVHSEGMSDGDVRLQRERVSSGFAWCVDALGERCSLLLEDSNGDGGRHLWAYFTAPVQTPALFALLVRTADACVTATGYRPELYPKQAHLPPRPDGTPKVGNWLRLPGLHHTRPHWSRLSRPGEPWARGADAAAVFLAWPATAAETIPPVEAWPTPEEEPVAVDGTPSYRLPLSRGAPGDRLRAILRYVDKLPVGGAGTGRSDHCYRLACFLAHDMLCTEGEALGVMGAWNGGNAPPLPDWKLRETWENAHQYGGRRAVA